MSRNLIHNIKSAYKDYLKFRGLLGIFIFISVILLALIESTVTIIASSIIQVGSTNEIGIFLRDLFGNYYKIFVVIIILFSSIFSLVGIFIITFEASQLGGYLSTRILKEQFNLSKFPKPEFQKNKDQDNIQEEYNSNTQLQSILSSESNRAIEFFLVPAFNLLGRLSIAIVFIISLLIYDLKLGLFLGFALFLIYGIIYTFTRGKLNQVDNQLKNSNFRKINYAVDSINNKEEIISYGLTNNFTKGYKKACQKYSRYRAMAQLFTFIPKYTIDSIAQISLLLVLSLENIQFSYGFKLPVLIIFAAKIIPSVQQSFSYISACKSNLNAYLPIRSYINNANKNNWQKSTQNNLENNILKSMKKCDFKGLYLWNSKDMLIKNMDIELVSGKLNFILGATGAGKSSLLRALIGVNLNCSVKRAEIIFDKGEKFSIKNNLLNQYSAYSPQKPFSFDSNILYNLTFQKDQFKVDKDLLDFALKYSCFEKIINNNSLYLTSFIGPSYDKLSGGQKSLLGIARALYTAKPIIMLDEPTSALDPETKKEVIKNLSKLSEKMIIVIITHDTYLIPLESNIINL